MQRNPGVAFIPKPMTAGALQKHPLNDSSVTGRGFLYLFYTPPPDRVANQNQPNQFQRRNL
jgi:hypothetical protein